MRSALVIPSVPTAVRGSGSIAFDRVCRALCMIMAFWTASAPATEAVERVRITLVAERTGVEPGGEIRIAAVLEVEPGWHTQSNAPTFDYLIPTTLRVDVPEGWVVAEVDYPPGEMVAFTFARQQPLSVYEGGAAILARLVAPDSTGDARIVARVRYQACSDEVCLPPTEALSSLNLPIGAAGEPFHHPAFGSGASMTSGWAALIVVAVATGLTGFWLWRMRSAAG